MSKWFDSKGKELLVEAELGRGGEAAVFLLKNYPGVVAKIYHKHPSQSAVAKIQLLVRNKSESLAKIAAWPEGTVHSKPGGPVIGFVMPLAMGFRPVHELYSPLERKRNFPEFDWRFLAHVAMNCCAAVDEVHRSGVVVGDFNQNNLLFSKNGFAKLIDVDSMQIAAGNDKFLCSVGVPEFTPPELQGKDFRSTARIPNHDCFGLAVVIFQLLMMGRHPYSGRALDRDDYMTEEAIEYGLFAYSQKAEVKRRIQPPPNIEIDLLSEEVIKLFERAFTETVRPTAGEWCNALSRFKSELKICDQDRGHFYLKSKGACPWCAFDAKGLNYFVVPNSSARPEIVRVPNYDLSSVLSAQFPSFDLTLPTPPTVAPRDVPEIFRSAVRRKRWIEQGISTIWIFAAIFGFIGFFSAQFFLYGAITAMVAGSLKPKLYSWLSIHKLDDEINRRKANRVQQQSVFDRTFNDTKERTLSSKKEFECLRQQCLDIKSQLENIDRDIQRDVRNAESNWLDDQRNQFLATKDIRNASFASIKDGRKSKLRSFGIESARDVISHGSRSQIPGFGVKLWGEIYSWAQSEAQKFKPNGAKKSEQIEIRKRQIVSKAESYRKYLNTEAQSSLAALRKHLEDSHVSYRNSRRELLQRHQALQQAVMDEKLVS